MAENIFEWVDFYKEFAHKLLDYKDNRDELIKKVIQIFDITGLNLPTLEKDNNIVDIDPFTVFGLFNKGIKNENRIKILNAISELFSIVSKVPEEFAGIPVLNNQNATFYYFINNRKDDDIDKLWELFEDAIDYSEDKSEYNKGKLEESFNRGIKVKGIGTGKLTMGLYWVDPDTYINLDGVNIPFIYKSNKLPEDIVSKLPIIKGKINSETYIEIIETLKSYLDSDRTELSSFKELSYKSWIESTAESGKRYWWLNANPKIWSFKNIEVGQSESYSLYNDEGNKRRIFENFLEVKPGDKIIGYESSPVKQIVALCTISKERDDEKIYFSKNEDLKYPIDIDEIKTYPELKNMEFFSSSQGSLFKLTEKEYNFLYEKIRDKKQTTVEEPYEKYTKEDFLEDVFLSEKNYNSLVNLLKIKKNVILQGAPGVGKTYIAKRLAYSIMGVRDEERVSMVQFHQSYSYEDFVEGYRPSSEDSGFEIKKGTFYNFCKKASNDLENDYFFIIDEINRGNLSKILGELFMLIENDKRGEKLKLTYSDEDFSVPENLYIIGMMNTADRSLALIDYALRRRFSFFNMEPSFDSEGFRKYQEGLNNKNFDTLIDRIKELNKEIADDRSLGKGFYIGHSFFCNFESCSDEDIVSIIDYEIIPLLNEYWFDNDSKLDFWTSRLKDIVDVYK